MVDNDDENPNQEGDDESYDVNSESQNDEDDDDDEDIDDNEEMEYTPYKIVKKKFETDNQKIMKEKKFGMHYHLGSDGHIYKYYHQHLKDGDKVVYECSDPVCKSKGIYYINEKRFEVISNHVGYWLHKVLLRTIRKDKFMDLMISKGYKDMHLSRSNGTNIEWAI